MIVFAETGIKCMGKAWKKPHSGTILKEKAELNQYFPEIFTVILILK